VSVVFQIMFGSALLILCLAIQIGVQIWLVRRLHVIHDRIETSGTRFVFLVCSGAVFALLLAHTLHIYLWAIALWLMGALPGHEQPIYFSLVTYTTVGYGDVTLAEPFRIFGAMASVNGILSFGLTTAFLVGLFPRIITELRDP